MAPDQAAHLQTVARAAIPSVLGLRHNGCDDRPGAGRTLTAGPQPIREGVTHVATTEQEILEAVAGFVAEETGTAPGTVTLGQSLADDLHLNSLAVWSVVVNVEDRFGIRIPDDQFGSLRTVGDVVRHAAQALA